MHSVTLGFDGVVPASRATHAPVRDAALDSGSKEGRVPRPETWFVVPRDRAIDRAGLIEPIATTREGRRPERTVYRLTGAGGDELVAWLRELLAKPVHEPSQFFAAVSLLLYLPPDDVWRSSAIVPAGSSPRSPASMPRCASWSRGSDGWSSSNRRCAGHAAGGVSVGPVADRGAAIRSNHVGPGGSAAFDRVAQADAGAKSAV